MKAIIIEQVFHLKEIAKICDIKSSRPSVQFEFNTIAFKVLRRFNKYVLILFGSVVIKISNNIGGVFTLIRVLV